MNQFIGAALFALILIWISPDLYNAVAYVVCGAFTVFLVGVMGMLIWDDIRKPFR